ncbi:hypothetical protein [Pseudoxanthomonas kaohsiungensis]|uniref:Uncharacterized protein n=1 Tax=Pseudoxanthomonas kaohsiungensis TaxID=283923 RepID=A0ABW3M2J5_9GAMM|nr:hypothetical protein [Pseudoxanthomonas kaohsiungensis]
MNAVAESLLETSPQTAPAGPVQGPYRIVGRTIVGAPQQRLDSEGQPIPGAFSEPSVCEIVCHSGDASRTAATLELLRASWEVATQRDELAQHLGNAINYIEHTEGNRRVMFDAHSLRSLLARELREGATLKMSYGMGRERTTADFDLQAARRALQNVTDVGLGPAASYAQLQELVLRLAGALQATTDERLDQDPRDTRASSDNALVNEAYQALGQATSKPALNAASKHIDPLLESRVGDQQGILESGTSLRP